MQPPKPKFGWYGQAQKEQKWPVGTRLTYVADPTAELEVIEYGDPPDKIKRLDLVHLRVITQGVVNARVAMCQVGYEDWWKVDQVKEIS